jgi:hypothetical protein
LVAFIARYRALIAAAYFLCAAQEISETQILNARLVPLMGSRFL